MSNNICFLKKDTLFKLVGPDLTVRPMEKMSLEAWMQDSKVGHDTYFLVVLRFACVFTEPDQSQRPPHASVEMVK